MNGRWTRTFYDGLWRTVQSGTGTDIKSIMVREYAACACSPPGKVWRVTLPFAPNDPVYWTTYEYDAMGWTTKVILPNNAGATTYAYSGYTVTVTDPAGKCLPSPPASAAKVEPNPAGGTWSTSYTYNAFNQLTTVTMPRPTGTQTRTFVYDTAGLLTSVTQPASFGFAFGGQGDGDDDVWLRCQRQTCVAAGRQAVADGILL